jgi:phenylacetate-coenzyme A ligase PaaK-like adenylate-forming protein
LESTEKNISLEKSIFDASPEDFEALALETFAFQYQYNKLYRQFCDAMGTKVDEVDDITSIPFLPIQFFKSHQVMTGRFEPALCFESSGTTGSINSKHFLHDPAFYKKSFTRAFHKFYGSAGNYCIMGLLPSYIEKGNSSLVWMVDDLIKQSHQPLSGFFLHDHQSLHRAILHNELINHPTLLIGVTYALLDFAEQYPMQLHSTIIMETGGMKGRRKELSREEVHKRLQEQFGPVSIHSEYGMTELLTQAYSKGEGIFHSPDWMKILIREEDDPKHISKPMEDRNISGAVNIIDLANLYSCAFIATDDIGTLHANGSFEILGRIDNSDLRGCGLLVLSNEY